VCDIKDFFFIYKKKDGKETGGFKFLIVGYMKEPLARDHLSATNIEKNRVGANNKHYENNWLIYQYFQIDLFKRTNGKILF
jgi:hypothetical protein